MPSAAFIALWVAVAAPNVRLIETPPTTGTAPLDLPWSSGAIAWPKVPVHHVRATDGDVDATVQLAMDNASLRLLVIVHDDEHVNHRSGADIWDGDSLQVSIDARGDGTQGLLRDYEMCAEDDAYITFALTDAGPAAYAHVRGSPAEPGEWTPEPSVVRDAEAHTTTYDITLAWTALHAVAGGGAEIGVSLQINDTDKKGPQRHLRWGGGSPGTLQPGLLHRLRVGAPPAGYVGLAPLQQDLLEAQGDVEASLVVAAGESLTLRVQHGGDSWQMPLTAGPAPRRWRVLLAATAGEEYELEVRDAAGARRAHCVLAARDLSVAVVGLRDTLARAVAQAPSPLLKRHFATVAALLDAAWLGAVLQPLPTLARTVAASAAKMDAQLHNGGLTWDDYLNGKRRLVLGFLSPIDHTLQPYLVRLPAHRDSASSKAPGVVFLHGKGDPDVLHFIASALSSSDHAEEVAIVLMPWGRGNMGYWGLGEDDVLRTLEDATRTFDLDPDRVGLMGFSMGGAGAWSQALHHPDLWSGVAIHAGGTWLTSMGIGLGENARGLPISIWHGDADGAVDPTESFKMQAELKAHGIVPLFKIERGLGHTLPPEVRARGMSWLTQQVRHAPRELTFVAEDFAHRGRNGILLRRDTARAPYPRLRCTLSPREARLETQGTSGLDVDLEALGFHNDVTVYWNGKKVYEGASRILELGDGAGRR